MGRTHDRHVSSQVSLSTTKIILLLTGTSGNLQYCLAGADTDNTGDTISFAGGMAIKPSIVNP